MVTGKAHLPLDDTGLGAKRAAFCEADDAAFAAVGPYAVLDCQCQQQAEECLRHCGRLRGSFDGRGRVSGMCYHRVVELGGWVSEGWLEQHDAPG